MADLTDFGGGVDRDRQNSEDELMEQMSRWLRHPDLRVLWDRDRSYGNGTFSVTTSRRPDLLIKGKSNNYIVEVKDSYSSGTVHDGAVQLFDYWKDLVVGEAEYRVDGECVDVDAALLATDMSQNGHLLHDWRGRDPPRNGVSDGRQKAIDFGQLPESEHVATQTLLRMLHRFARRHDDDAVVGIGGLLSSALDGENKPKDQTTPAALFFAPGRGHRCQNWDYIPFYEKEN